MLADQAGASGAAAAGSQGGPGTTVVVQGAATEQRSQTETKAEAAQGIVDRLVSKFGTMSRALEVLAGENFDYRETNRELSARVQQLGAKQVPDGAIVLTGEDAKSWNAIKAIEGVTPDKVPDVVKKSRDLEMKIAATDRESIVGKASESLKWNPKVLAGLLSQSKLDLEMRDTIVRDGAGKESTEKVPYVRKAGDASAAWEKLSEFGERDFKDFLPALRTAASGGGNGSGPAGTETITPMPGQGTPAAQGATGGDVVDNFIGQQQSAAKGRVNPLSRRKPDAATK